MSDIILKDEDKIKGYELIRAKYEKLENEEKSLEEELKELEIRKFALITEKRCIENARNSGNMLEEINHELGLIKDEIDEKDFRLKEIDVNLSIYNSELKLRIDSRLNK